MKFEWGEAAHLKFWIRFVMAAVGLGLVNWDMMGKNFHAHPIALVLGVFLFFVGMWPAVTK